MASSITIPDSQYSDWVKTVSQRYHVRQINAAVKVNQEQIGFYFQLGHDIVEMHVEDRWGQGVLTQLSKDLAKELPGVEGLSVTNIRYCRRFYLLYKEQFTIHPQPGGELSGEDFFQQAAGIFQIPWGHHKLILDKVSGDISKALFYVQQTIENNWSRATLHNWIDTNLYDRKGKALSNFENQLPAPMSDLAREITKDPYNFAFADIRGRYNEKILKEALLKNITDFLIELGTGFAYVGKEYRLQIGDTENFIDLLFYHLELRCYVVIEVKIDKFASGDIGQLGTYVVACNHLLKRPDDNPTIGLLVCKSKDNTLAQYALEGSNQPIAISQYELEKLYPAKVEGFIPSVEEIENQLNDHNKDSQD